MKLIDSLFTIKCLLLIGLLTNCISPNKDNKNGESNDSYIVDIEKAIESTPQNFKLSDFVEDIEYIRPEYPATLVQFIFGVSINDNYLLLEVKDKLLCYTRDGKFIREIGSKGQGPKEHLGIRASALYDNLVAIHSNYNRKILWYNTDGDFLRATPVSDNVFKIDILDTSRVVIHLQHGIRIDEPGVFIAGVINEKGENIQLKTTNPFYHTGTVSSPSMWKFNDSIRVLTCINDTIYSVGKNKITPAYSINWGKYKISQEAFADINLLQKERSQYVFNPTFCETNDYILTMFEYSEKRWVSVYNKQSTGISAFSISPDNVNKYGFVEGGGWLNDVDGGFSPTYLNSRLNGYFLVNVQPRELKAQFLANKQSVQVKYPEKQQQLENLINSLDDDENPVIILYKLKKIN